jgi:ribosomal protein L12E/L44/L45/RPP1/RPP2
MSSPNCDLFKLFTIWNPKFRRNSCVGYAPTKGRRCGWEMDGSIVAKPLKDIGSKLPNVDPTKAELMKVATDALCNLHKNQASDIATKWKSLIDDLDLVDLTERMRNARMNNDYSNPQFSGPQSARGEAKWKQHATKKQEEEERKRKEERVKEDARKEQERKDREEGERKAREEGEKRSWRQVWIRYASAQILFKGLLPYRCTRLDPNVSDRHKSPQFFWDSMAG